MTESEGELPLVLFPLFEESESTRPGPPFASALFGDKLLGDEHLGDELKCVSYKTAIDDNHSLLESIRKPTWKCGGESVLRKKQEEYHTSSIELCRMFAGEDFTEFRASCNYYPSQKDDTNAVRAHEYSSLVILKVAYDTVLSEATLSCTIFKRMASMVKDVITFCNTQLHDIQEKHGYITPTLPKRYNRRAIWHDLTVLTQYKEEYEHGSLSPSEYAGLLDLTRGKAVTELRQFCGTAFMGSFYWSVYAPNSQSLYTHDDTVLRCEWNHFLNQLRHGWIVVLHTVYKRLLEYSVTDGDGHISEHSSTVLLSEIKRAESCLSSATKSYELQGLNVTEGIEGFASTCEITVWVNTSLEQISRLRDDMNPCNRNMYLRSDLHDILKVFITSLNTLREREVEATLLANQELKQDFERLCS